MSHSILNHSLSASQSNNDFTEYDKFFLLLTSKPILQFQEIEIANEKNVPIMKNKMHEMQDIQDNQKMQESKALPTPPDYKSILEHAKKRFFISPLLFHHIFVQTIQKISQGRLYRSLFYSMGSSQFSNDCSQTPHVWFQIAQHFNNIMKELALQSSSTNVKYKWIPMKETEMRALYYMLVSKYGEDDLLQIIVNLRVKTLENLQHRLRKALSSIESNSDAMHNRIDVLNSNVNELNHTFTEEKPSNQSIREESYMPDINLLESLLETNNESNLEAFKKFEDTLDCNLENYEEKWILHQNEHVNRILSLHNELLHGDTNTIPEIWEQIPKDYVIKSKTPFDIIQLRHETGNKDI